MTIYAVIGEDCDCIRTGTVGVTTTTSQFYSGYARCALTIVSGGANANSIGRTLASPLANLWFSATVYCNGNGTSVGSYLFAFYSADGVKRLTVEGSGANGILQISTYNAAGTRVVIATANAGYSAGEITRYDLNISGFDGNSGSIYLYNGGALVASATGVDLSTEGVSGISLFRVSTPLGTSGNTYAMSEIMVSDTDTRSMRLVTLPVAALGNSAQWTGAATDVNETTLSDATLNSSATAGQRQNYTVNTSKLTAQMAVRGLVVSARASRGASGPQNIKLGVRTGGADYDGAAVDPGLSFSAVQQAYDTNPGTGADFTVTQLTDVGFNLAMLSQA